MKKFNLTLALTIACFLSRAQTNTFPPSGNVGIGTTSPGQKLVIVGSGQLQNISNGADQDLMFSLTPIGATDKYALIAPSTSTNLAFGVANAEKMRITNTGNLGIGTTTPQTNLHIVGSGASIDANAEYSGGGLIIQGNTGSRSATTGAQLEFVIPANSDGSNLWGQARIATVAGNNSSGDATGKMVLGTRRYYNKLGAGTLWYYGNDLVIDGSGNVAIGAIDPQGYKLAINGSAIATSMTVKLYANWPDYVFKPTYHLPSLTDVKTFINKNHHLPDMPSAQQVANDGINLGEMNKLLTKKVEELTMYLIEKDKKDKEKEALLSSQQYAINLLKAQVKSLIKYSKNKQ